jgi:hypothetical protein
MFIKKQDHDYFIGLFNSLDEKGQQRFLNQLRMLGRDKSGTDITKIKVIDDSIYDVQAIDSSEIITRTLIKKAYKTIKEGK